MTHAPAFEAVRRFFLDLQARICAALEDVDGESRFRGEDVAGAAPDLGRPRVLEGGPVIEKAAVNFSSSSGAALPPAATAARPAVAGRPFRATAISLIVHPRNPYAPTSHANFRYFEVEDGSAWWFGGGFDLTPYYGFEEDAVHWHRTAKSACDAVDPEVYVAMKEACDRYFFLPHRGEPRGIGGVFFDDLNAGGFARSFALTRSLGLAYLDAYRPILERRHRQPYGERERDFQLYRRGRYVEFNLVYDRGTLYGMQSGRRIESVLASLPPVVHWRYEWQPEPGTPEARLYDVFLVPRDWAAG